MQSQKKPAENLLPIITDAHENREKMTEFDFSSVPIVIEESAKPLQETQDSQFEEKTDFGKVHIF